MSQKDLTINEQNRYRKTNIKEIKVDVNQEKNIII